MARTPNFNDFGGVFMAEEKVRFQRMNVLAAGMEIPDEQLQSLRGHCVQNVKKTNGSVTLDNAVRYQNGG